MSQFYLYDASVIASPPSLRDGLTLSQERRNRCVAARLLISSCQEFAAPSSVFLTAQSLMQRFFLTHSMRGISMSAVLMACLLLASKAEEFVGVSIIHSFHRAVIQRFFPLSLSPPSCHSGVSVDERKQEEGSEDERGESVIRDPFSLRFDAHSPMVREWNKTVPIAELVILRALGHSVYVLHPHSFIEPLLKNVIAHIDATQEEESLLQEVGRAALLCLNDSMATEINCTIAPLSAAVSALIMAFDLAQVSIDARSFVHYFHVNWSDVQTFVSRIRLLYEQNADSQFTPCPNDTRREWLVVCQEEAQKRMNEPHQERTA